MSAAKNRPAKPATARAGRPASAKPRRDRADPPQRERKRPPTRDSRPAATAEAVDEIVVGYVPSLARAAGILGVVCAVGLLVRPLLPLATAGGHRLGTGSTLVLALPWLPAALVVGFAGGLAATGRLPRLALGVLGSAGGLSIGLLLRWIWLTDTGARTVLDLPVSGQPLQGDRYGAGAGLWFAVVTAAVLVAALMAVAASWSSTVMDDDGRFDRVRPTLALWSLFVGAVVAVAYGAAPSNSSLGIARSVLQSTGLDRIGGLVLVAAIVVCCVVAPTARPRLATTGTLLGAAVMLFGLGFENLVVVAGSPDLHASFGTVAEVVAPLLVLMLVAASVLAAREPEQDH